MNEDVQRSLGRIEGTQSQILAELVKVRSDFAEHKAEDARNFSAVRNLVYEQKSETKTYFDKKFEDQADARNQHLNEQDIKLDRIMTDKAIWRAKMTAGQKFFAAIGGFALFCITIYQAFFSHK